MASMNQDETDSLVSYLLVNLVGLRSEVRLLREELISQGISLSRSVKLADWDRAMIDDLTQIVESNPRIARFAQPILAYLEDESSSDDAALDLSA